MKEIVPFVENERKSEKERTLDKEVKEGIEMSSFTVWLKHECGRLTLASLHNVLFLPKDPSTVSFPKSFYPPSITPESCFIIAYL